MGKNKKAKRDQNIKELAINGLLSGEERGNYPREFLNHLEFQAHLVMVAWLKANGLPFQLIDLLEQTYNLETVLTANEKDSKFELWDKDMLADIVPAMMRDIAALGCSFEFERPVNLLPCMPAEWHTPARLSAEIFKRLEEDDPSGEKRKNPEGPGIE